MHAKQPAGRVLSSTTLDPSLRTLLQRVVALGRLVLTSMLGACETVTLQLVRASMTFARLVVLVVPLLRLVCLRGQLDAARLHTYLPP